MKHPAQAITRRAFVARSSAAVAGTVVASHTIEAAEAAGPFQAMGTRAGEVTDTTDPLTPSPRSTSRANPTRPPQKQFPSRKPSPILLTCRAAGVMTVVCMAALFRLMQANFMTKAFVSARLLGRHIRLCIWIVG